MLVTSCGDEMSEAAPSLIVLTEREFTRGCLLLWLRACCPEFDVVVAAELGDIHPEERSSPPVAIVVHASGHRRASNWVEQQIEAKGRYSASAPTILIVDAFDADLVQNLVSRGVIDAFIPMSDTTEVAAAALRLVIAGGHYMPLLVASGVEPLKESGWSGSAQCHGKPGRPDIARAWRSGVAENWQAQ